MLFNSTNAKSVPPRSPEKQIQKDRRQQDLHDFKSKLHQEVINKIDIDNIDLGAVKVQLTEIFKFREENMVLVSAKQGINIDQLFEKIVD